MPFFAQLSYLSTIKYAGPMRREFSQLCLAGDRGTVNPVGPDRAGEHVERRFLAGGSEERLVRGPAAVMGTYKFRRSVVPSR